MTTAARSSSRSFERYLPIAYFLVALALIAVFLPSALRPPPQNANNSAEFSPDAPPDKNDSILSSLGRAQSGTTGEGNENGIAPGGGTPPVLPPRACPRGYGNPPRQVESVYAAPCAAPFTGNNGGATSKGVTANEIRLALIMCTNVQASNNGPIDDKATDGNARDKTLRAYQRYFNQNYQFYGRRLQIISLNPKGTQGDGTCSETNNKAMVIEADDTYKSFGIIADIGYTYAEAVRRKLEVAAHWTAGAPDYYRKNYPYMFSPVLDADALINANTEFVCKQVAGKNADFTDDPNIKGKKRKIGLIAWAGTDWGADVDVYDKALFNKCGRHYDDKVTVDTFDASATSAQTWSTIITKFRNDGITTISPNMDYVFGGQLANAASAQQYFPEWLVCGCFAWDTNIAVHFFVNSAQWRHAFGITAREVPRPQPETDWYRAYQEVETDGEADETVGLVVFPALMQYANGIQAAGPNLNPQTFMQGLLKIPQRTPDPIWSVGGGYSPGDLTYPDWVDFVWWNSTDLAPDDSNGAGAYRHVYGGKKFRIGELPTEPVPFFKDGVTGVHGS
jgi:hypothetical protein